MLCVGDCVIFALDGARGVVLAVSDDRCQVMWEDYVVSWEKKEWLTVDAELTKAQRIVGRSNLHHPL
ncbi:hypothetical protein [Anoxybacteroides tepidamans]|uniref:hypothetical protein n=1 Tax=Anoxybacteroides tepidamans TaxID=265948 RepID=UPI0004869DED|nr:hypothetical protein [Anoxybacillus tepidamans]